MNDTNTLELATVQPNEPPMKQLAPFDEFRAQAEKLRTTAETLTVTDINDKAGMKLARATRLELRSVRLAIEARRKELGEHHLRETQRINGDAKALRDIIEPLEERLEEQEKFIERETLRLTNEKRAARSEELAPFLSAPCAMDLGTMTEEAYASLLADSKALHAARLEREAKERAEAEAKAKAEAEERERIRLENERLRKEAAQREEAARKEREAAAAALAKEREEAARLAREAQAKAAEEAKKLREEAAKENARLAAIAEEERQKAAKAAREAREAKEKAEREAAEIRAAQEKAAAEKKAAEEAAAAAPEKEKLRTLASAILELYVPELNTEKGQAATAEIKAKVEAFAAWVNKKADAL